MLRDVIRLLVHAPLGGVEFPHGGGRPLAQDLESIWRCTPKVDEHFTNCNTKYNYSEYVIYSVKVAIGGGRNGRFQWEKFSSHKLCIFRLSGIQRLTCSIYMGLLYSIRIIVIVVNHKI